MRIHHPTEVNRVRKSPRSDFFVATRTSTGDVLLFDYSKHPCQPASPEPRPDATLQGHSAEGFALEWSRSDAGRLASGGSDGVVCVWDAAPGSQAEPVVRLSAGGDVTDVSFHAHGGLVAAANGDDGLKLWDVRAGTAPAAVELGAHVGAVDFAPKDPYLIAFGLGGGVAVRDLRKLPAVLEDLPGEADDEVHSVAWAPWAEAVVGASGEQGRVRLFDLGRPEPLFFVHAGHRAPVAEFAFAPEERVVVSPTTRMTANRTSCTSGRPRPPPSSTEAV